MDDKVTIHDIARLLKVSPSTVSRALNNNPRISNDMRDEIQKLAREHGYRRNSLASSLRRGKSMTAGVVIPRITRFFFSGVIGGMEEILSKAGFNLMICQTLESFEKETENLKTLLDMQVDVIFISLSAGTLKTDHLKEIIKIGKRVIMFDRVDDNLDIEMVKLNDYEGAYNTVVHMLQQGYKKIAHLSGPEHLNVYRERINGYLDALKDNGIEYQKIIQDVITKERGIEAFKELKERSELPDAIFAASDYSALGAVLAARKYNISVPEEIGIAGFANEPFTEFVFPGITSTDQKAELMGERIAKIFLDDPEGNNKLKEIISPELIVRNSTLKNNKNSELWQ
jgi:LacI family transcriptional regulator